MVEIAAIGGVVLGYIVGRLTGRLRHPDIQDLIDIEATRRQADGIYRRGDDLTETEPVWHGVYRVREVVR
jgi:hypothetical protein